MTRAKGGPEVALPKAEPVTPDEVVGWFLAAGVTGADPAAVADFAAVVEAFRAHNGRPADGGAAVVAKLKAVNAGDHVMRAFLVDAEALTRSLFALWAGPAAAGARSPAMAALLFALLDVCKMPAPEELEPLRRKSHRATLPSTAQTIVMNEQLAALLPPDATMTALRSILRAARKRIGWKDLPSAEIGRLLARSRFDRAAPLAQTLVAWPALSSVKARPATGRKKSARRR